MEIPASGQPIPVPGDDELPPVPEEQADETYEASEEDEAAFLKDLGIEKPLPKWDNRSNNPKNKPMPEAVTEEYHTEGGKEMRAVHDEMGTFWHVEFTSGGQLPAELKGAYTSEPDCRKAIRLYLAKKSQ